MREHNKKALIIYFMLVCVIVFSFISCKSKTLKLTVQQYKVTENNINKYSENKNKETYSIIQNKEVKNKSDISNNDNDNDNDKKIKATSKKEVYLTFDDGPTTNTTRQILNILKQNNIKATFFVIGSMAERNPKLLKELSDNNMCVLPHTYSHRYTEIFSSPKSYIEDLDRCTDLIGNITGKEVIPYIRIPGGMENKYVTRDTMSKITNILREKGINYVGWNICTNDAVGKAISVEQIKDNFINQSKKLKDNKALVVLMHDSYNKKSTVEALAYIISYYKNQGYEFKTFNDIAKDTYDNLVNHNVINKDINKAKIK